MPKDNPVETNIAVWETLAPVDSKYTKKITGKSYQGDSPNPTYVIRKLTEVFGPIGKTWGFEVIDKCVHEGIPHEVPIKRREEYGADGKILLTREVEYEIIREKYHEIHIRFWFAGHGHFDAIGGTPMLYKTKAGKWIMDEDAAKKSLTDAYVKGASWLGACADIFLGIYDTKFHGKADAGDDGFDTPSEPSKRPGKRSSSAPESDDGWS